MRGSPLFCALVAFSLFACSDTPPTAGDNDTTIDAGGDVTVSDTGVGDEDVGSDTQADASAPDELREVIASIINRSCIGCDTVSWCDRLPISEGVGLELHAAPNHETGLLFAAERWESFGRRLSLESCKAYTDENVDPILTPPSGLTVLDAGEISLTGTMPALGEPLAVGYHSSTRNYSSVVRPVTLDEERADPYQSRVSTELQAAGGADIGAFTIEWASSDPIEILTPATDGSGQIDNISTSEALEVTWSGGADFDEVVIYLEASYCTETAAFVMCRANNDGSFEIPVDTLSHITWPNIVLLSISSAHKVPLEIDELSDDAAWSVRSLSWVPIYHDPDATPAGFACDSTQMSTGFAGNACAGNDDCGGGCCLPEQDNGHFMGNYCSVLGCNGDTDCPDDAVCAENTNPFVPWMRYCAKRCSADEECRVPEYLCLPTSGGDSGCVPGLF